MRFLLAFLLVTAPARAGDLYLPPCDHEGVLSTILTRQNNAEVRHFHDGVRIETISTIRQTHAQTKFVSAIEHRHCTARADLGNERSDQLYYVIAARQGFASIGWSVDFCLTRHDPYRVYGAACEVLR